jgi:hypothetical protein
MTSPPRAFLLHAPRTLAALLGTAMLLGAPRASADDDAAGRRAAAEALFDEGKRLAAEGRYSEACPKFAESQELDAGVGTLLNLADCLEKTGRTASAWAEFRHAAAAAHAKGQAEREQIARQRAASLETTLSRLIIEVSPETDREGLVIRRDGEPVGPALWGTAVPVDPGLHVIEAVAPGKQSLRKVIEVPTTGSKEVTAVIPVLHDAGKVHRIAAVALGGLGIAGLVAGSVLGVQAIRTNADAGPHCGTGNLCDAEGVALRERALVRGNASTATFAVGALALAGGVVLWVTAPRAEPTAPRVGLGSVGPGAPGLMIGGAW